MGQWACNIYQTTRAAYASTPRPRSAKNARRVSVRRRSRMSLPRRGASLSGIMGSLFLTNLRYMTRKNDTIVPDLLADPFEERSKMAALEPLQLLGGQFRFESNSPKLLRLVNSAYAGIPRHRLSAVSPRLRVRLLLRPREALRRRSEPPPLSMLSGSGFLGGATNSSNFVVVSPSQRAALVVVSQS